MKSVIDAYKIDEYFYTSASEGTLLPRRTDIQYRDIPTQIIYTWDGQHYRDRSFHQAYTYYNEGQGDRIDTNKIYLARPGQRILGVLNGIDEDSCSLTDNLNNTSELTFVVDRIINTENGAEVSSFYDLISRHYELYLPHHGWFKINEEPELDNNGNTETKSVRAESLEIELQQYDLVNFRINMATEDSKEMLAIDNTFTVEDYTWFYDQVLFYRDIRPYEAFLAEFEATDKTVSTLQSMVLNNHLMLSSPRLQYSTDGIDDAIVSAIGDYRLAGDTESAQALQKKIGKITSENPQEPKRLASEYPLLLPYLTLVVDQTDKEDETVTYSLTEVIQREIQRQKELSLMYLILHEHGWTVGYVDPTVLPDSEIEDDRIPLANKVGYFDKDSQDIYSFLTQDVSAYYRCIFVFDTENYLVNCYNINNIGYDTNIYLSFHNIQNEVTRSSDRDLYTVFHVQGAEELDFTEANLGEDWITDISYFLKEEHFSLEFIEKYDTWAETREQKRIEYIQASKDYRNANSVAAELYDRVPIDNADGGQYSTMNEDELLAEKANMEAEKRGYESLYVDDNGDFDQEALEASDDWKRYKILTEQVLSSPLDALDYVIFIQHEESDDYEYGFDDEHPDYRLGNIDIALFNLRVIDGYYVEQDMSQLDKLKRTNVKNQKEYLDDYRYNFERYGDSYGVAELENQVKILKNNISTLEETGYDESDGTVYDVTTNEKYIKYTNALAECEQVLDERKAEYETALEAVKQAVEHQNTLKADAAITNPVFGFTAKELWLLDKYYIHTDYVNENILITSQSTDDQIVDTENQLYLDAMEELYVESHPQYTWSTTQDNLLLMPEFQDWHGDMHVGNFLRVSMRDDYQVKLRVSSITLNPLMIDPTIQIGFTTMTQYRSKRNDYTDLLASANTSTKNQISSTLNKNAGDNTVSVDTDLVLRLLSNPTFSSYMGNQSTNVSANAINAVSGSIDNLVSRSITADKIVTGLLQATDAQVQRLTADSAFIQYLNSGIIEAGTVSADTVIAALVEAQQGDFDELTADSAFIQYLNSGIIEAGTVSADTVIAALVDAQVGDFDTLTADTAFVQYLQSVSSTTATSVINDAYIYNAVAGKISVADLAAGNIVLTNTMRILSENGQMVMNGQALQIMGEDSNGDPYVGIQLGYDTNENPSLILRNEDGATILTPDGITTDAIADGLIINNMIHDGTIQKSKLGFQVMESGDSISIEQIYTGDGQFGAEWTIFKNGTSDALDELRQDIEDSANYDLYIETPNGTNIWGGNIQLNVKLLKNNVDVTDDFDASCFIWTRTSRDHDADLYWNSNHSTGAKVITITGNDVRMNADFQCKFEYNNVTVVAG